MTIKNSLILLLALMFFISCSSKNEVKKVEEEKILFGTAIKIVVYHTDEAKAFEIIKNCFSKMEEIDKKYNSRSKDSIVSKINDNPTKTFSINEEFYNLMNNAINISEESQGHFDITIGPIMETWGFDNLSIETLPTEKQIKESLKLVNYKDIKLTKNSMSLSRVGQKIDTGAFLKGYAVYKGKEFLVSQGITKGMITAISSIETIGNKPDGKPFKIGIQNPKNPEELIYTIELEDKALGVSGDYQTYVEINGKRYHHIIDSKTGYPSEYNSMLVVLGKNAYECDLYSTMLFAMKAEDILNLVSKKKDMEVLVIDKKGKKYFSRNIKKYLKNIQEN